MGPLVRIGLRYASGALVAKGFLAAEDATLLHDPELEATITMAIGATISVATEYYYYLAKRFGWSK